MRLKFAHIGVILGLLIGSSLAIAHKVEVLEPNWGANSPSSHATINHKPWQQFLHKYLYKGPHDLNLVHYALVSQEDRKVIDDYLDYLQSINIQHYNSNEQLAYWINLFNAEIVNLILDHYPQSSIVNINIGKNIFDIGPSNAKTLNVLGYPLSLHDIHYNILLKYWKDPRIPFALCNSAMDSPNLRHHVYRGNNVDKALTYSTADYINSRGAEVKYHKLYVSKLFMWDKKLFGGSDATIIEFIQRYAKPQLYQELDKISYISGSYYNWNLNG